MDIQTLSQQPAVPPDLPGTVLIVDDEPFNRELLRDLLEPEGHNLLEAKNGAEALEMVAEHHPGVILLDVMMPAPDGFEVCRRLKGDPETAAIPILLVTALADRESRLRGIRSGANDFLSKPIDTVDAVLRVRNALRMKQVFDLAVERFHRLRELEALRDSLVHMVVHDLKAPLSAVTGYAMLLQRAASDRLSEQEQDFLRRTLSASSRMLEMVTAVLDVSKMESGKMELHCEDVDLCSLAASVVDAWRPLLPESGNALHTITPPSPLELQCDAALIGRVLTNLIDNAVRHASGEEGRIEVEVRAGDANVRVSVTDNGPGIPEAAKEKLFQKFGQLSRGGKYSTGLGLVFCKMAVEAHGGALGVETPESGGARFWFTLPYQALLA